MAERQPLYVVSGRHPTEGDVTLYHGPDNRVAAAAVARACRAKVLTNLRRLTLERGNYPPPERNKACLCHDNPLAVLFCPTGHVTACHWPLSCQEADCDHERTFQALDAKGISSLRAKGNDHPKAAGLSGDEAYAAWLGAQVSGDDTVFPGPAAEDTPACKCSRCGLVIQRHAVTVHPWGVEDKRELRYHPECIGHLTEVKTDAT
jgi:hypothetical protein